MTKDTYLKMVGYFSDRPKLTKVITYCNKILTGMVFLLYPLLLIFLFLNNRDQLVRAIIIPADGFIVLSIFRYLVNRQRPYEKFETPSVIPKDTKGKSFPSRHVFSAGIIAMTVLYQGAWMQEMIILGIALWIVTILLAAIRVVSGVHFISDVLAGIGIAVFVGIIGYTFI